jgi:glycosyltransferase involved in cell wall biosynthesis
MTRTSSTTSRAPLSPSHLRGGDALHSIAFIGTYVPRACGIATFTADLLHAVSAEAPAARVIAIALNDVPEGYDYPAEVQFEIAQQRLGDYRRAAACLNVSAVDVVCVQHEYGIFGGTEGDHIVELIGELRMPTVATLHTVLKDPAPDQKRVLCDLARSCDRLVVMSKIGRRFLRDIYDIPADKIELIPHGVPDRPFVDASFYKSQFGLAGKKVILTFGLLSPNKGIETMVRALPPIVACHPNAVYVVLGATHPRVKEMHGESYRSALRRLAQKLAVDGHLVFRDQFVELSELCEYLGAADIYVTPYLNEAQVVSGTLSYAMATGRAIVSTPYWHATEMLADGRGRIVPFNDAEALAVEINGLLYDDVERAAVRKRAYDFSRSHVWKEVARRYLALFQQVRKERSRKSRLSFQPRTLPTDTAVLPELKFDHLERLTDDVGILQHALYNLPNRGHGYCTDDNARALLVVIAAKPYTADAQRLGELGTRYLSFLQHAFSPDTGMFRNLMGYDRHWLEERGSDDSHGRTLWALGVTAAATTDENERCVAAALLRRGLPAIERIRSPRAIAHALLGIDAYLGMFVGDSSAQQARESLANRLLEMYHAGASPEWPWLEDVLTYANGAIPCALLAAGTSLGRKDMTETALRALAWLSAVQTDEGHYVPIGNNGWYSRGGERARFDQQPIEAASMIPACVQAYHSSGERAWLTRAGMCFHWFTGDNDIGVPIYDKTSGGCCDGIEATGPNQNQGAESTLAWLYSLTEMYALQAEGILGWATREPLVELARGALPLETIEPDKSRGRRRESPVRSGADVSG